MLQLFLTPTSIVFENMTDVLYATLSAEYDLQFEIEEGEYKITAEPQYLYKLIVKLSYDFDIEVN